MEEAPWSNLRQGRGERERPLDARGLALRVRQYGIKRVTFRDGIGTSKGYRRVDLEDAWMRYLPPQADKSETSVTRETQPDSWGENVAHDLADIGNSGNGSGNRAAADVSHVSDDVSNGGDIGNGKNAVGSKAVSDVTDVSDLAGNGRGQPICMQCGRPGGNEVACGDGPSVRLHRECESAFNDRRTRV